MIREVTMYQAVCDGCGRVFGKVYSDIDTAVEGFPENYNYMKEWGFK